MIVEALDALVPLHGDGSLRRRHADEEEKLRPYLELRHRIAAGLGMGFYDTGRNFLERALHYERYALTDSLHGHMSSLLKQPNLTRRTFREGMIAALQQERDVRHYRVNMPLQD